MWSSGKEDLHFQVWVHGPQSEKGGEKLNKQKTHLELNFANFDLKQEHNGHFQFASFMQFL